MFFAISWSTRSAGRHAWSLRNWKGVAEYPALQGVRAGDWLKVAELDTWTRCPLDRSSLLGAVWAQFVASDATGLTVGPSF
jgi:hypothetical protein